MRVVSLRVEEYHPKPQWLMVIWAYTHSQNRMGRFTRPPQKMMVSWWSKSHGCGFCPKLIDLFMNQPVERLSCAEVRKQWLANQYDLKCAEAVELRRLGESALSQWFKDVQRTIYRTTLYFDSNNHGFPVDFTDLLVISKAWFAGKAFSHFKVDDFPPKNMPLTCPSLTGDFRSCRIRIPLTWLFWISIGIRGESHPMNFHSFP